MICYIEPCSRNIQKKVFGLGMTTLLLSNEGMDNMKIMKSLEESCLWC